MTAILLPLPYGKDPGFPPVPLQALTDDRNNTHNVGCGRSSSYPRIDYIASGEDHAGLVCDDNASRDMRHCAISGASNRGSNRVGSLVNSDGPVFLGSASRHDYVDNPHGNGRNKTRPPQTGQT